MLCRCNIAHPRRNASTACGNAIKATQLCGTLQVCVCIITQLRGNASTACGNAIKATPLLWDFRGLCAHHNAVARKRKHSPAQRNKSHPASVAPCGAVRALANSEKIAAHMHESRRCVVLRRDMLTGAALPTRFVRGLRLIWLFSLRLQLPASIARRAASSPGTGACASASGSVGMVRAQQLPRCVLPT